MERTLVVLKPDAVGRRLVGRIIQRFEDKGLALLGLKMLQVSADLAERMYEVHKGKDFYQGLVRFVTSGPVVAMVLSGNQALSVVRGMMGATFGPDAAPGTIRGDFGLSRRHNLIHGSDSSESAAREIPLFFAEDELVQHAGLSSAWVYDVTGPAPL